MGLSNRINTTVSKCQFPNEEVSEIIKSMVLQHEVKYHQGEGLDLLIGPKQPYHTNPSWLTAGSWKPDVSNSTRLKLKEELT